MNHIRIAVCSIVLLILAGCKGGKELISERPVSQEVRNNFESLMASYPDWNTFSAKGSADLSFGASGSLSASTQLRMVRGEVLQISVRIILGIEVARLYMTPDSLFLVNKMQKQYVAASLQEIGEKLSSPVSLQTVQDALLGRIFLLNSANNAYGIDDFEVMESGSSRWSLSPKRQDERFGYRFDLDEIKLLSTQMGSTSGHKEIVCHYTDFIKQGQSENFPTKMKIALTGLSVPVSLNLRYDSSSVSWNGKVGVEKPALSKYTRVSAAVFSQTLEMEDLRKNRERTLKELNETNKKLNKTLKSAKNSLNELNSITAEIRQQRNLISKINREIAVINRRQRAVKDTIYLLQKDLTAKKRSYANAVKRMGHQRSEYDELMFIFSASSLSQSYRRARYLKEYSAWRKRQAAEIAERKQQLEVLQKQLAKSVAEKNAVLKERNAEAEVLKKQEGSKRTLIAGLKKQEKQLKREIDRKRKQAEALDRKLEQLIAEEERKSSTRADKTEGKNSTAQQRPTKGYKMTKEELALSGSFEKNKGKLPFPLSGSYKIVAHFGRQKHPELRYVQTENSGIDIETTPGTKARAVFNGVVSRIFVTPGYNSTIIVRHGNYLTIYANLSEVYVRAGEKVSTGQNLGKIYSDSQDGNRTILTFQLWKERTKLNPELWLNL